MSLATKAREKAATTAPELQVIDIGSKGLMKCRMGNGDFIHIDITATHNRFIALDKQFRDDKGEIATDKIIPNSDMCLAFVRELFQQEDVTLAMAFHFLRELSKEDAKLRHFFGEGSPAEPSSPGSTATSV